MAGPETSQTQFTAASSDLSWYFQVLWIIFAYRLHTQSHTLYRVFIISENYQLSLPVSYILPIQLNALNITVLLAIMFNPLAL